MHTLAGLDIGGTKIAVSLANESGQILAKTRIPTTPNTPPEALLTTALDQLTALTEETNRTPTVLGVAAPGPLSYAQGCLLKVPNMPLWQGFALQKWLSDRFDGPVGLMNDANASMLAEHYWGAAKGINSGVFLTMSTGMGAGLLLDGRVYEGPSALAGEIGHIRLRETGPVGFGKRGSVEGYLSGPGMVQVAEAERLICRQRGEETLLSSEIITPRVLCEAARAGDAAAVRCIQIIGDALGRLCALLVDLLNPQVIILGTIGTAYPDLFIPPAMEVVRREAIAQSAAAVSLVESGLVDRGNQTAAAVARRLLEQAV
ncbi:MAG: glucokinase [Myxococcota bacterium]|jgi:glucokinase